MEKNKIGEKVEEWEMKGHGCWAFPYPPSLPISSFTPILNGYFGQGEEDGQRSKKELVTTFIEYALEGNVFPTENFSLYYVYNCVHMLVLVQKVQKLLI
jgi:hypothetical protein